MWRSIRQPWGRFPESRGEGKEGEAVRRGRRKDMNVMEQSTAGAKINVHAAANHWQMRARSVRMSTISQDAFMHWKINIHTGSGTGSKTSENAGKRFLALALSNGNWVKHVGIFVKQEKRQLRPTKGGWHMRHNDRHMRTCCRGRG